MDYKTLLQTVADEYKTRPDEVEKEIKNAISAAGLDISPQLFISLCTAKAIDDIL